MSTAKPRLTCENCLIPPSRTRSWLRGVSNSTRGRKHDQVVQTNPRPGGGISHLPEAFWHIEGAFALAYRVSVRCALSERRRHASAAP